MKNIYQNSQVLRSLGLLAIFVFCFSNNGIAQETDDSKPFIVTSTTSMRYVPSLASRSSLIPAEDVTNEAKDGRSKKSIPVKGTVVESDDILAKNPDPMTGTRNGRAPSLTFDAYSSGSQPTDPSGATGPNHYFAVFNTGFIIYDKAGVDLTGQLAVTNIFSAGGCCDLTVSYDKAADRWVVTYLFFSGGAEVAVSDGPNPVTAGWNVYTVSAINDYQKLSVWSDGYYITENTGGTNKVWALERDEMLLGNASAQVIGFNIPGLITSGFFSPQALNVSNDNMPATGSMPIVYYEDDNWSLGFDDQIRIWEIDVDWVTPVSSTISSTPQEIGLAAFNSVFDGGSFNNLAQPSGGGGGGVLDALQSTIMNQAQFRRFPTHNSALLNFVVDTNPTFSGKLAGIRWVELRQSGDGMPWSLYQEGTYTAPDGKHAWMGSMMMDVNGNIAMGYTGMSGPTSTSTVRVSSYYTGRLAGDPLGTMTIAEVPIAAGTANIPGASGRYGDYSKIDIDPNDDKTFWFITEYNNGGRKGTVGVFEITSLAPCPGGTTEYFGSAWTNGIPDITKKAIIRSDYSTFFGSFDACELVIKTGATLSVIDGTFVNVENDITVEVDAVLDVLPQGSVVQVNDNALVTKFGTIVVHKTTPSLLAQDFMIMGSPMTNEDRGGVYGSGRLVLQHIAANFVPHPGVGAAFPLTENFADDNGDNWAAHTGLLNPGEGYLVRPQPTTSSTGTFTLDYTLGTLNNGVIPVPLTFNGSRNASANILSNPYASAIDVDVFLVANPEIDAVYYWEHITPPSMAYPGFNQFNFDMGDISAYNAGSGGVAAANGGGVVPTNIMASTQGFGVKALALGNAFFNNSMRLLGPNGVPKSIDASVSKRNRIWLELTNDTYKLGSNMLVAFVNGATNDFEGYYDTNRMGTPVSIYSILKTGEELSIQGKGIFHIDQEVQLGFSTMVEESQQYTISIRDIDGADILGVDVYLEDKELNIYTNLSEENYSFTAIEGTQENRFVLLFKSKQLTKKGEALQQLLSIVPNPSTGLFTIVSPNTQVNKVEVIDLQGRFVSATINTTSDNFIIDITSLDSAMYFVKIYTSEGVITKRILKQ